MKSIVWFGYVIASILGFVAFPAFASAQQSSTETMTIQVQGQTPLGSSIIGMIVVQRACGGSTIDADVSFNGMVNGQPAAFSGKARDTWLGQGQEDITILSTSLPNLALNGLPLQTLSLRQTSANTITLNGLPLAIDKPLQAPCTGDANYVVTSAGQGSKVIQQLPNTASHDVAQVLAAPSPWRVVAALLALVALVLGGMLLVRSRTAARRGAEQ